MSQYKEFMLDAPIFLALVSVVLMSFVPPFCALSDANCTEEPVKPCQICPRGTFANEKIPECDLCFQCNRLGQCSDNRKCTPCRPGYFKPDDNSALCKKCHAGSYTNMTGQTMCIDCPAGFYCPAGAVDSTQCDSYQVCPAGSGSPGECEPPWHSKIGNECVISNALIVVIVIIIIPIALAVIIVIIYKLYQYWKMRRLREILGSEREPLLPGSRPSSRIQEPVYTGL